jgi:hypothetical protein
VRELSGFRVGQQVAVGGDAILHDAVQIDTGTQCVVKVVEQRSGENGAAFDRRVDRLSIEGRALRRLSHPNIVKLLEFREDGELPILALE